MSTEARLIMTQKEPQPILPPLDYTVDEIDAAECLLMLSLSGRGTCLRPSSSSGPTMSGTPETVQDSYTTSGGEKFPSMRSVCAAAPAGDGSPENPTPPQFHNRRRRRLPK
ncbi:hypothetical protein OROGR_025175 [Orobanche gracilis]